MFYKAILEVALIHFVAFDFVRNFVAGLKSLTDKFLLISVKFLNDCACRNLGDNHTCESNQGRQGANPHPPLSSLRADERIPCLLHGFVVRVSVDELDDGLRAVASIPADQRGLLKERSHFLDRALGDSLRRLARDLPGFLGCDDPSASELLDDLSVNLVLRVVQGCENDVVSVVLSDRQQVDGGADWQDALMHHRLESRAQAQQACESLHMCDRALVELGNLLIGLAILVAQAMLIERIVDGRGGVSMRVLHDVVDERRLCVGVRHRRLEKVICILVEGSIVLKSVSDEHDGCMSREAHVQVKLAANLSAFDCLSLTVLQD